MDINIFKLLLLQICATGALCQQIIVHPENATVKEGDNITLSCEFDKPVKKCFWRNGYHDKYINKSITDNVDRRYKFSDAIANGRNTRNCSLFIEEVDSFTDNHYWYCSNAGVAHSSSNKAYLTVGFPEITVNPQNATVVEGDEITLQCKFDVAIEFCEWRRNGEKVKIRGTYQYSYTTANGINTNNCSILIRRFGPTDATHWQCVRIPIFSALTLSKIAYLRIATTVKVHPKNATVLEGSDVTLQCKFNKAVDNCAWFRNGSTVEIRDRYRYCNSNVNGNHTDDCSITIRTFRKTDATSWQCFSALNSDNKTETCMSNPAYLTISSKIIVHPENATVKEGGNITLRCEFDKPVEQCFWFRTWGKVNIRRRYQYSDAIADGRNTSNCSLFIQEITYWEDNTFWWCNNAQLLETKSNKANLTVVSQEFTVNPQNATVVEGNDIILRCEVDVAVKECGWRRNGSRVEIDGRYHYSDTTAKGRNTRNCSLLIKTFERIDATYWKCFILSFKMSVSKPAYLRMATTVNVHPKNATVLEGEDKILQCQFNKVVDRCLWLRNGSTIDMTERYRYAYCQSQGTNTKDCSIEIRKFRMIDATSWQCFSSLNCDIKKETCMSNPAYLTIYPDTRNKPHYTYINNDNGYYFERNSSTVIIIFLSSILAIITITAIIIYYRRSTDKKKNADARLQSTTSEASQSQPGPDVLQNFNHTTQQKTLEEDSMKYVVLKQEPIDTTENESYGIVYPE